MIALEADQDIVPRFEPDQHLARVRRPSQRRPANVLALVDIVPLVDQPDADEPGPDLLRTLERKAPGEPAMGRDAGIAIDGGRTRAGIASSGQGHQP